MMKKYLRLTLNERVQHLNLFINFTILVITVGLVLATAGRSCAGEKEEMALRKEMLQERAQREVAQMEMIRIQFKLLQAESLKTTADLKMVTEEIAAMEKANKGAQGAGAKMQEKDAEKDASRKGARDAEKTP